MSEFVKVRFQRLRTVYINGKAHGKTNQVQRVSAGNHHFDLGDPQNYTPLGQVALVIDTTREHPAVVKFNLSQESAESLSNFMSVIAQAKTYRQREIDRLQAEIKTLTSAEQILRASPPRARR